MNSALQQDMNKLKICLALLGVMICIFAFNPVNAQTLPQNLSNFNVDNYSDDQIRQLLQNAQSQGLTDSQLIQMAESRNLPASEAQRLQARINEIRKKDGNTATYSGASDSLANSDQLRRQNITQPGDTLTRQNRIDIFRTLQPKIFGASLFRNAKANTFQPNLKVATPLNYIIGPDDKLIISVYGNSVANWSLTVTPDGNINIPGVGILNVAGKTIEQATASIKSRLAANRYAIGNGTSVQVSLGDIRSISVRIQGELVRPGTYTMASLSTAFDALYAAGGPSDIGSFRKIEIIRDNRVIRKLDLYDYLVHGNHKDDIVLRDQDEIHVPPYGMHIELRGEVKVPAIFEPLPTEKLQNIIDYAGGFTDQAYTARIKVLQTSDRQRRIGDILEKDFNTYVPKRGDVYTVDRILNRFENRVLITGAVFRPGEYELQQGLTVSQLIKNAGGLKEDAFTARGSIIRLNPDNTIQQLSFNIQDAMSGQSGDVILQREDSIYVTSVFNLRDKYKVTIKGQVRKPGDFNYADSMKVADLILKAGGFAEGASSKRIEVSRRVFDADPSQKDSRVAQVFSVNVDANLKYENINFTLRPFDIVSVYSLPGYETQKVVKVEGEVIFPGYYTIEKKNEKISDLIRRAGGLTQSADIEGGSLKRDNAAVLGVNKTKLDTLNLSRERAERLKRLQRSYKDTIGNDADTAQFRNNYVGIDLKKILARPGNGEDLILENGDVLRVPKEQQTVRVNGEVLYPSAVVYNNGKSFKGYVLNAGGFSPSALKRGAYIVYPNGTVKGTTKFLFFNNHPKVKPGSEIYVPKKPVSKGDVGTQILAYTTGLASLGAIILGMLSLRK